MYRKKESAPSSSLPDQPLLQRLNLAAITEFGPGFENRVINKLFKPRREPETLWSNLLMIYRPILLTGIFIMLFTLALHLFLDLSSPPDLLELADLDFEPLVVDALQ